MKNMYSFQFNIVGFSMKANIISDDIGNASIKAYEKCAERVGDLYQKEALRGDYLVNVGVVHDVTE